MTNATAAAAAAAERSYALELPHAATSVFTAATRADAHERIKPTKTAVATPRRRAAAADDGGRNVYANDAVDDDTDDDTDDDNDDDAASSPSSSLSLSSAASAPSSPKYASAPSAVMDNKNVAKSKKDAAYGCNT
jgi:hypothetical protein